ncbi:alpha/beta hydrolase [Aquimarina mytili]|uniref:Alpha/beta hydrolase n=1 Tax=Aquimarina mytili TaxID=874423 RepID=A0A936ZNM6_9FLAO|nr:alpha/beta hydrolase-fold protein [Aquimarina mytili]MBL0682934.1 alpha/beta hydrolase [Aquimarina mytili]
MKTTKLLLLIFAISLNTVFAQKKIEKDDSQTVEKSYLVLPKIEVIPIKDTKVNRQYELYVKLPEGYSENNDRQYPVIYYTDAIWHVEILSSATEYIMEEAILVGISWQKDIEEALIKEKGAHVSRFRDYSVGKSSNTEYQAKYQFGQAGNHLDFIRNDVLKYVETNYRTDSNNRSYFGYSLGGEFGAYILLKQSDTFKNYILGSPSFGKDITYFSELISNITQKQSSLNANVFISYGTLEKDSGKQVEEFIRLLRDRNDKSLSILPVVIEGNHRTAFPRTGVRSVTWLASLFKEGVKSNKN